MKLLLITTDITICGGIESVISTLMNYLVDQYSYDVEIVSLYKNGKNKGIPHFKFNDKINLRFLNTDIKIKNSKNKLHSLIILSERYLKLKNNIKKILKESDPDIVMTFHHDISISTALNKKYIKGKFIITEHGEFNYGVDNLSRILRKIMYKRAEKLVILAEKSRALYEKISSNIEVIPNPVRFKTDKYCDFDSKKIICVGRLAPAKGFDQMIDIFNLVSENHNDWNLSIFGDGEDREKIVNKIEKYKLQDKISIHNFSENIKDEMLKHSILAVPSRSEAFSMVIIEGRECSLPCISFDLIGPSEIINNGVDGEIIELGNKDMFAERLSYLMENDDIRKKYGIKAKKDNEKYYIENIGERWNDLFRSLKSS